MKRFTGLAVAMAATVTLLACVMPAARAASAPELVGAITPTDATRVPWVADRQPWYYSGLPYGSDALINPLRLIIDGGFGTLQFDNRSNMLGDVRFGPGWRRVVADVRDPVLTINAHGWNDFLGREVIPISVNRKDAQYWPNYTLHLVGGGMSYVMMGEWFEAHGFSNPRLAAGATLTAYHVLNEVVEADHRTGPTTDAVGDLLVFDPAGVWLFSHEGVNEFFSRRLHLHDWSTQPAIDPTNGALENQGQNFSIKVALPHSERWSFFYYFGNHGEAGLSYRRANGTAFSAGGGFSAKGIVEIGNGVETADLVPSYGFFYDREGSLLFSVTSANTSRYRLRVNAYPGLIGFRGRTAGLFALLGKNGETIVGVHLTALPIGLAGRVGR